jgi:hypothetical protein
MKMANENGQCKSVEEKTDIKAPALQVHEPPQVAG